MLSDRCLFVCSVRLSVTLAYCGQTVGWIKMPLGLEVGLGPGHNVLDGDPASSTERGTAASKYNLGLMGAGMAACICKPRPMSIVVWRNGHPSQQLQSSFKFQNFNCQYGLHRQCASSCQISRQSPEPLARYVQFLICQNGSRPLSGIGKF